MTTLTTHTALDEARSQAFSEKMLGVLNSGALALMTSIGHRTGLFDTMAGMEPATSEEIARAAGLNERYVREWLGAMTTGGVVEYDGMGRYQLPPEHAAWLTRSATPNNMAAGMQFFAVLGAVEDLVVDAFRHGQGVPYEAYKRFHPVMAEESSQTVVAGLEKHILPLVPGLIERLEEGIDVLDVGCGSGYAINAMATLFPRSRFTGYDFSEEAITTARREAQRRNLSNAQFEQVDVAQMDTRPRFDLITAFDAIHDQARPDVVLANIHASLREGGVFLMQDIGVSSHVHCNHQHPMATFIYTISCMHCMSVSLANQGMGLGAAWGREKAQEMLREAGFRQVAVHDLPHDIMNAYFVAKK